MDSMNCTAQHMEFEERVTPACTPWHHGDHWKPRNRPSLRALYGHPGLHGIEELPFAEISSLLEVVRTVMD